MPPDWTIMLYSDSVTLFYVGLSFFVGTTGPSYHSRIVCELLHDFCALILTYCSD